MTKVIDAWTFLEMLNPRTIPSVGMRLNRKDLKGGKSANQVVRIAQSSQLQELELANPAKKMKHYQYYMNSYRNHQLTQLLRDYFKNDEELYNKNYTNYYAFTFEVNADGEYIEDSLFIPHIQLVIDDIEKRNTISYDDFTERYYEKKTAFEEEFTAVVADGVDQAALIEVQQIFKKYFQLLEAKDSASYIECIISEKDNPKESINLNSFYLDDLQLISKEGVNGTLQAFIKGKELEVEVDEEREVIEAILAVDQLPLGRWPSPVNHRLSLMQQVAVNQIINGNEAISSVNGPPGTGKTTLLKDIFAELIVKRARAMAKYSHPTKAFKKREKEPYKIKFGDNPKSYPYGVYKLKEDVGKYAMVVASSNNGAVENISKELPLLEEIVRYEEDATEEMDRLTAYEAAYAQEAKELDYFREYAEDLLEDEDAWGLFSAAFGKASNIKKVGDTLKKRFGEHAHFLEHLEETTNDYSWEEVVQEFTDLFEEIEADKIELKNYVTDMQEAEILIQEAKALPSKLEEHKVRTSELAKESEDLEIQNNLLSQRLDNLPKPSFIEKILAFFSSATNEQELAIRKQRDEVLKQLSEHFAEMTQRTEKIEELKQRKIELDQQLVEINQLKAAYQEQEITLSTDDFWAPENYENRQMAVIWQANEMNFKRGLLFLKAMKVHKVFLQKSHQQLKLPLKMLEEFDEITINLEEDREIIKNNMKVLQLIFPVMSTTFASFRSMYQAVGADFIDYLFIDEAGQASPQQAAGALWRSKRAIVVGDPIQIEPIVTLDETILADIRKSFGVDKEYIGTTASVQTVADQANPVGAYKDVEKTERIGIPLWVHRRCIEPMFSISNEMAYDNKMVLAMDKVGESKWHHVLGKAEQAQYVKEQGQFIAEAIEGYFAEADEDMLPSVFVITPFSVVSRELRKIVEATLKKQEKLDDKMIKQWVDTSIGTVHTFQGKEADIVYFVTGTDKDTDGAADWSCAKPNLLNVAATRAKKDFYVVGDFDRFQNKQNYQIIVEKFQQFEKEES